jgi:hypothetical protein
MPMKMNRSKHLYVERLKDLHNAENQLIKAPPKMAAGKWSPRPKGPEISSQPGQGFLKKEKLK